jgi:stage II sporulation protein E
MMESIPRVESRGFGVEKKGQKGKWRKGIYFKLKSILLEQGWLFYFGGFLLGRAVILSAVSPFAIAFVASMWFVYREKSFKSMLAVLAGALTYSMTHAIFIGVAMLVFIFLAALGKQMKNQQVVLPLAVFASTTLSRMFLYSLRDTITSYEWLLLVVEGVLGAVLVLIFMQSIPLLSPKRYKPVLKNE